MMKRRKLMALVVVFAALLSANAQTIVKGDMDGSNTLDVTDITMLVDCILNSQTLEHPAAQELQTQIEQLQLENLQLKQDNEELRFRGHEYVDLGLPSGTLWATCNVGATSPEEYGDYFAWGEISPYYSSISPLTWKEGKSKGYAWASYQWCKGYYSTIKKYCNDSTHGYNGFMDTLTTLESADDAATANWQGDWHIPTQADWMELNNSSYCKWTWYSKEKSEYGVAGYKVQSLKQGYTDNYIFLPSGGSCDSSLKDDGFYGVYWTSSLFVPNPNRASYFNFGETFHSIASGTYRCFGQSVRPVVCP